MGFNPAPLILNAKITGVGIAANANIAGTFRAEELLTGTTVGNAYVLSGSPVIRLDLGTSVATTWADRFLSHPSFPTDSFLSSAVADFTVATLRAVSGTSRLFWPVGGSIANVFEGSRFTLAGAWATGGILAANPQAQFAVANTSTNNGSNQMYLPIGQSTALMLVSQQLTATGVAAGTSILAFNPEWTSPVFSPAAVATNTLQAGVGTLSEYAVGRKVGGGPNIPANTFISALGTEPTVTTLGSLAGSGKLFFTIGASTAGFTNFRHISHPGIPGSNIMGTPTAQTTRATTTTVTGSPNIFWPGGAPFSATVVPGAYINAGGITGNARIVSTVSSPSLTVSFPTGSTNIFMRVGDTAPLVNQGISESAIPLNARVTGIAPELTIASVTTNGTTTITSAGLFSAGQVGKYISHPDIPANARITVFTNANTATISVAATGSSSAPATLGQTLIISAATTAVRVDISMGVTSYVVTDTNATVGSTATATIGANIDVATATSTVGAGVTSTLGAIHTLSQNYSASGSYFPILSGSITMSQNATTTSQTNTANFAPYADTTTPASGNVAAGATGNFGGTLTVNSNATATDAAAAITMGRITSLSANNTATGSNSPNIGAIHTLSANATAAATTTTVTFGAWLTTVGNALATIAPAASLTATFGAYATLNAATPIATLLAPLTLGGYITANANITANVLDGAFTLGRVIGVSVASTATTAANTVATITFGRWADGLGANATASTSVIVNLGPISTLSNQPAASGLTGLTFGIQMLPLTLTAATTLATSLKLGAILAVSGPTAATATTAATTYGNILEIDQAATVTGSTTATIGGNMATASPSTATGNDITATFGGAVALSSLATATAISTASNARIFPWGAGNSAGGTGTTFNLPPDPAGRAIGVSGDGTTYTDTALVSTTNGSTTLTVIGGTGFFQLSDVGRGVSGTGIQPLSTIAGVTNGTTATLNVVATVTGTTTITVVRQTSVRAMNARFGSERHLLSTGEMPQHTHTHNAPGGPGARGLARTSAGETNTSTTFDATFGELDISSGSSGLTIDNTGGSVAHNLLQPTWFGGRMFIYAGI